MVAKKTSKGDQAGGPNASGARLDQGTEIEISASVSTSSTQRNRPQISDKGDLLRYENTTTGSLTSYLPLWGLSEPHRTFGNVRFFCSPVIDYGVGCISWTGPRGPNRHAQKRSISIDIELKDDVRQLMKQGRTQAQALEQIAKDPNKQIKFKLASDARSEAPDWSGTSRRSRSV